MSPSTEVKVFMDNFLGRIIFMDKGKSILPKILTP